MTERDSQIERLGAEGGSLLLPPCEDGLLSDEIKLRKVIGEIIFEDNLMTWFGAMDKAIEILAILKAHEQETLLRIKKEILERAYPEDEGYEFYFSDNEWQSFWDRELK